MIEAHHLYKSYPGPVHALRDIHLKIQKGEFVFMTGPSGAGKTTLFRMLSAFDRPTSGHLHVAGFDLMTTPVAEIANFRKKIGVVFQDYRLLHDRTISENVALPLLIRGMKATLIRQKVSEMLEHVGLQGKADQIPLALSGGEQQRASIARALIHQPEVLIADEPTGNLDPKLAEEIMDLLEKACVQGTTVFVATHDHDLVRRRKKRHVTLAGGQIFADSIEANL